MTVVEAGADLSQRSQHPSSLAGREEFLEAARVLAVEIARSRRKTTDGGITWQRPNRTDKKDAPPLVPAGPHLYDGSPGIAVFFAALGRVESNDLCRDLSLKAVAPLRLLLERLVAEPERARKMSLGIGGLVGLGSFVHALVTLGRLLELPELFEEAHRVCGLITREHIAADQTLDVVGGASGAILALLALDRILPGPTPSGATPLDVANACADHLLSRRVDRPDGTTVWTTNPIYPPLTGFAHGSTGIACALLKLHARTGRRELLDTALRAWAFERSTFSEEHGDWIDQTSPALLFFNQWCFGAPGIALGRLMTLDLLHDEEVWKEIRTGLEITSRMNLSDMEHICCGGMGRVDVLVDAAERLGEPELFETACELARRVLAKAEQKGRFDGLVRSAHRDPSLFSGEAGIGYTLLRLARPGELPCLLAME
jgi:type 2 lantibiotic biosynthesis protein LanM